MIYQIIIYFALFSFLGWVCETVFCTIKDKKLAYRGFLNGPICPVYGFGGLIVVYLLAPFQNNVFLLFLMGTISTTILEYVTHWVLEKLFHAKWWDYSDLPLNIHGRVCVRFSLIFGALSVAAVKIIYPPAYKLMNKIPSAVQPIIAIIIAVVFVADLVVTVWSLLRMNGVLAKVQIAMGEFTQLVDSMEEEGLTTSEKMKELYIIEKKEILKRADLNALTPKEKRALEALKILEEYDTQEAIRGLGRLQIKRITQAFPRMESTRYKNTLADLREKLKEKRKEITKKQSK